MKNPNIKKEKAPQAWHKDTAHRITFTRRMRSLDETMWMNREFKYVPVAYILSARRIRVHALYLKARIGL